MNRQYLNGKWELSFTLPDTDEKIKTEVEVPCNAEPYLVKLGLLTDYMPADDTLIDHTAEYTVTAYNEDMTHRTVASGICRQRKNSVSLIQRIAESEGSQLWAIKWSCGGKTCFNHVFTGKASYEVMREWIRIIGAESGNSDAFLELK